MSQFEDRLLSAFYDSSITSTFEDRILSSFCKFDSTIMSQLNDRIISALHIYDYFWTFLLIPTALNS